MNNEKEVIENDVETLKEEKQEEQPQGKLVAVSRRYYINQEFSDKLANDFCEWVDDVVEFDELWVEQYPDQPLLPVVITISSRGGVVDSLNQNTLNAHPNNLLIVTGDQHRFLHKMLKEIK